MPVYNVTVSFVETKHYQVEAESPDKAREGVLNRHVYRRSFMAGKATAPETWGVTEVEGVFLHGQKVPETAQDLQLFSGMKGVDKAAKKISQALLKAATAFETGDLGEATVPKRLGVAAERHLYPVMEKYSKYGAMDTEPRYVVGQFLVNVAKQLTFGHTEDSHPEFGDYLW